MKIAVCLRQGQDGEINPFDASAYECALSFPGAQVTLVSMGPGWAPRVRSCCAIRRLPERIRLQPPIRSLWQ